ncbi:phosphopyruvate hydratase [Bifidobacterium sp. ESL0682]|uniref:phosphopyruvate hydratase n=1 Tax=Bifidobacterium sp. ESL0682 TaxID=2983212 RepID=UPI0023F62C7D|nr:phosphopyruvate hydratase [Bifidobacterium sp. ESL0682]WEV42499.1 phosphopyruvate hydratase [Bifidobacterium sp. ESL0682]
MAAIESVYASEILDSRGNPTVKVVLDTVDGAEGIGLVPSGASTGEAEAWERRDGDKSRYQGKGVLEAVKAVNEIIAPKVIGMDATDQRALDETMIELDGTPNKGKLGANAILGVSLAALYAAAESAELPLYRYIGGTNGHILPVPNMNIMNGGAHADFATDIQEYMISPYGFDTYSDALRAGVEVYHTLKGILKKDGHDTGLGDEGGFAPKMKDNEDSLKYIVKAIEAAGYEPGRQIGLCLDVASSEFYNKDTNKYHFDGADRDADYMLDYYKDLVSKYPLVSIEDPFAEEDWPAWQKITAEMGDQLQFVGDDLLVTNPKRLQKGIDLHAANSLLVKLNQIGTVTETLDAIELATANGFTSMVSHRSGETPDTTISDLAVAKNTRQIKTGAPARGERIAKYNRLLEIEEELGSTAEYAGYSAFKACKKYIK